MSPEPNIIMLPEDLVRLFLVPNIIVITFYFAPPLKLRRHADGDGRGRSRDDWISIELYNGGFEEIGKVF